MKVIRGAFAPATEKIYEFSVITMAPCWDLQEARVPGSLFTPLGGPGYAM